MNRWLRRLLKTLLGLLLVPVLLLALGLALLQTDWARAQILRVAEQGLREHGLELELRGLDGFLPFNIGLQALDLADPAGTWLELRDLRLAWSPAALLTGRVLVEELSAGRIALARAPELPPAPEPESEPEPEPEPFEPPRVPEGWPPLVLERLELARIQLGAPLLGEAAEFSLVGRGRARAGGRAGFELRLVRARPADRRAESLQRAGSGPGTSAPGSGCPGDGWVARAPVAAARGRPLAPEPARRRPLGRMDCPPGPGGRRPGQGREQSAAPPRRGPLPRAGRRPEPGPEPVAPGADHGVGRRGELRPGPAPDRCGPLAVAAAAARRGPQHPGGRCRPGLGQRRPSRPCAPEPGGTCRPRAADRQRAGGCPGP